jgi:hypothetical protein
MEVTALAEKGDKTKGWRKLKLHNLYLHVWDLSLNITKMTKLRGIRWAEHVLRIEAKRDVRMILLVKRKGRPGLGGNVLLEWILKDRFAVWTRFADSE